MTNSREPNRLSNEKSPYLLQHAYNPVDWYPWGDEAFRKAKNENKPIFLSIGYSSCHWCHVMEEESFEDIKVAEILNDNFISIKVDREERPDIDNIYMTVCQMLTGSGGWPLTIIITPDKEPFYAATYIPKESRFGRTGMLELLPEIKRLWDEEFDRVQNSVESIMNHIKDYEREEAKVDLDKSIFEQAYNQFKNSFDNKNGGFGNYPKFPTPHNLMFLLRYYKRTKEENALRIVQKTLDSMARGGIFDHLGYGFHRYSTDSRWILPHFEKMLYDQALLCMVYIEAFQITESELYKNTAKEIIEYVLRDMTYKEGGFYSAEDADSEGEEGRYYVWGYDELRKFLNNKEIYILEKYYNIKEKGNYKDESTGKYTGFNILYMDISNKEDIDKDSYNKIEEIKSKLFNERHKRVRPLRDEKILTDWNGIMIAALCKAYCVFSEGKYIEAAKKAMEFILKGIDENKKVMHRYFKGQWNVSGNLDDYAFLIYGLIELYEATFNFQYIDRAIHFTNEMIDKFRDEKSGGLFFTAKDEEKIIFRSKEAYDGAVPSGNSTAAYDLIRLSKIANINSYEVLADEISKAFSRQIKEIPSAHTMMLMALDMVLNDSFEVVIVGDTQKKDTADIINLLRRIFVPNVVVALNPSVRQTDIQNTFNYNRYEIMIDEKATAYVCSHGMCMQPTNDINKLKEYLE